MALVSFEEAATRRKRDKAVHRFYEAYKAQIKKQYDDAVRLYHESIGLYPTAEAYTFLGWTHSFMGELDTAISHCQQAIELDPDFGNSYNDIGAYLIARGQFDEALPYLQKALEAPRYNAYHFAHFNIARVYEKQGNLLNAYRHYREALDLEPRYWVAHKGLQRVSSFIHGIERPKGTTHKAHNN